MYDGSIIRILSQFSVVDSFFFNSVAVDSLARLLLESLIMAEILSSCCIKIDKT